MNVFQHANTSVSSLPWTEEDNVSDVNASHFDSESNYQDYGSGEEMYFFILWTLVAPVMFGLITLVGIVGNGLVIYVIVSQNHMRTVTNIMLLNLAIADISFLVVCVPFTAYKYASSAWQLGDVVCKVVKYFLYVTSYVTVYTLVSIAALRFVTIVCHGKSFKVRTRSNVGIWCCLIWIITLLVNIPVLVVHKVKYFWDYSYCGMENSSVEPLFLSFFLFAYAIPLVVICVLYVIIIYFLHRAQGSTIDTSRSKTRTGKACRIIVLVVLVFALCWLPLHINSLVAQYGTLPAGAYYETFRVLWNCMAYGNSCANPFIYNYSSMEFRKCFYECFACTKQVLRKRRATRSMLIDPTETTNMVTSNMVVTNTV